MHSARRLGCPNERERMEEISKEVDAVWQQEVYCVGSASTRGSILFADQQLFLLRTGATATRATAKRAIGAAGFAKLDSSSRRHTYESTKRGTCPSRLIALESASAPIIILVDGACKPAVSHAVPFCWTRLVERALGYTCRWRDCSRETAWKEQVAGQSEAFQSFSKWTWRRS